MKRTDIEAVMFKTHEIVKNESDIIVFQPRSNYKDKYSKYVAFTLHNNRFDYEHSSIVEAN